LIFLCKYKLHSMIPKKNPAKLKSKLRNNIKILFNLQLVQTYIALVAWFLSQKCHNHDSVTKNVFTKAAPEHITLITGRLILVWLRHKHLSHSRSIVVELKADVALISCVYTQTQQHRNCTQSSDNKCPWHRCIILNNRAHLKHQIWEEIDSAMLGREKQRDVFSSPNFYGQLR